MMHWATDLIGRPWVAGARGPDSFDCWGLFLAIQREHFGRDLPEIPVDANDLRTVMTTFRDHPERQRWMTVPQPAEGDAVLLELLDIASRSSGQLQRLIASLMDISRLEAGQPVGQQRAVSLHQLVADAYDIDEPNFARRAVVLLTWTGRTASRRRATASSVASIGP